jgi:carboxyl-terminal processing protease
MSRVLKLAVLAVSAGLIVFIFAGSFGVPHLRAEDQEGAYRQMQVYSEVLKRIQNDYVEEPNISTVTTGALHGLLESLDADSSYLSPSEYLTYKQLQNQGRGDLGIVVSKRFGYASVVSVQKGSPADRSDIEDGDIIEAIGNQSTREMSVATVRDMLAGAPGSAVSIALVRPRKLEPEHITLTRAALTVPTLGQQEYESNTILYLKPGVINADRVKEIESRLKNMPKTSNKKVLLDLRDTAQGDDAEAIKLANFFLKTGVIASLQGQKYPKQIWNADANQSITEAPLAVLVNHGTAGAAELVAAAILENKRGDVVGERTFGEGAVQKTFNLPDGAALILSIAKYYGPDGKTIEDEAVTPNVEVAAASDGIIPPDESVDTSQATPEKPANQPDDQLDKALEVLKQKAA